MVTLEHHARFHDGSSSAGVLLAYALDRPVQAPGSANPVADSHDSHVVSRSHLLPLTQVPCIQGWSVQEQVPLVRRALIIHSAIVYPVHSWSSRSLRRSLA